MRAKIEIPNSVLTDFCRRRRIRKLSLFGSVLRDDFGPQSDVDVLVEFEPEARVGYFELADMEGELSELLGHEGGHPHACRTEPVFPRRGAGRGGDAVCIPMIRRGYGT